jgi:hypothetical protein
MKADWLPAVMRGNAWEGPYKARQRPNRWLSWVAAGLLFLIAWRGRP